MEKRIFEGGGDIQGYFIYKHLENAFVAKHQRENIPQSVKMKRKCIFTVLHSQWKLSGESFSTANKHVKYTTITLLRKYNCYITHGIMGLVSVFIISTGCFGNRLYFYSGQICFISSQIYFWWLSTAYMP